MFVGPAAWSRLLVWVSEMSACLPCLKRWADHYLCCILSFSPPSRVAAPSRIPSLFFCEPPASPRKRPTVQSLHGASWSGRVYLTLDTEKKYAAA